MQISYCSYKGTRFRLGYCSCLVREERFFLSSKGHIAGSKSIKYVSYWNQTLQQSQKRSFYCTIKDDYSPSPYLALTRKNPSRKALVRFRISSHQLRIETGRYENIPRNERICHFCTSNKIEDENHFLLDCKAYSQIRDIFFSKLETKIPDFKSLSHDTLISLLMNSSDYLINCQLVSFISQCFELRTKLISMNE